MSILLEETGCLPSSNAKDVYVENSFANSTTQVGDEDVFYMRTTPPSTSSSYSYQTYTYTNCGVCERGSGVSSSLSHMLAKSGRYNAILSVCLACVCDFIFHAALATSSSNMP